MTFVPPYAPSLLDWQRQVSGASNALKTTVSGMFANVTDYAGDITGVADSSAPFASAAAAGPVFVPLGVLRTASLPSSFTCFSFGGTYSGATPVDAPYPAFGTGAFRAIARGTSNCIIGIAHNNLAASTNAEPCAVTGYGRVDNTGNIAFGLFGRADLYATTGVVTNEFNSFNYGAAPANALPPNRAVGTTQSLPIGITVAAGGTFNSAIGVHICREGSAPQSFLTGQYIASDACVNYGIVIDAVAGSTFVPALIKHGVGAIGMQIQGVGVPVPGNAAFSYVDGAGVTQFSIKQSGQLMFASSGNTATTVGAAGGASALPATPTGYLLVQIGAVTQKVPYYAS